ncbi:MAG: hypothetical protein JWO05_221 [Gemmatimonadetes bacterium]|nr:hypothetical protein [Gemmatimonadota bacterium]
MLFAGPGEMRALCRATDWSSTPLGAPREWSQSLRTTVGIVLDCRNPMFLWWGPDLVQFYNDAYRPSLGQGDRHPRALGAKGREFWTDIWGVIGPQVTQVMTTGESTWHVDQHLPIERNGTLEDVWWTYSYSPVRDDDGQIAGTLVVCLETTERVVADREREELLADTARAERRVARVLEQVADEHLTMDSDFRILWVNDAAIRNLGKSREQLVGLTHWEAFPASLGTPAEEAYRRVQRTGVEEHLVHHYVGEGYDRHLEIDVYPTDEQGVALFWREVTARVHAEFALRDSEARLRAIYDGTYEYIGLMSPDGMLLDANRASLDFAGSARHEVVGKPFWDGPWFANTPGAPDFVRSGVQRAARGEFVRFEALIHRPDGAEAAFDISFHPVFDSLGEVVLIVPEGREITERRQAEEALRESEQKYRTLFESLDEGFCVQDIIFDAQGRAVDYRFVEVNPAFLRQTGLVDPVGRRILELAPGLERQWFDIYGEIATTGEARRFEAHAGPLGRWFDAYAFRVGKPGDRRVAVLFSDVTAARASAEERERLLAETQQARARATGILESMGDAYFAIDRDFILVDVNGAMERGVKLSRAEMIGRNYFELFPNTPGSPFERHYREVSEGGVESHFTHDYLDARLDFVVEVDAYPLEGQGVAVFWREVTARVRADAERTRLLAETQAARDEAEAASRAKSEFLAVMSHELRTPLNAIGGYAELMEMGIRGPVSPQQSEDLRRIQSSQRHLLGLINEVLNYAKLGTGTVHFEVRAVPVRETLLSAESLVSPQARAKGLRLEVEDCPAHLVALADPEKLRQVLVNLLSNAVKFTDQGGRITMSCSEEPECLRVVVRDTGIGIPHDKLEAIFDPFVQVRSDLKRLHEGTGLGLAISRDLARGMNGDLEVESLLGKGSAFTLSLPRAS